MELFSPKFTKTLKFIIDEYIPPIIRDRRWFYYPIIKSWNAKMDIDFKEKVVKMGDEEFTAAYEALVPMRQTDMSPKTIDYVLGKIEGEKVLEVGCGNGDVSYLSAQKGFDVVATDLAPGNLKELHNRFNVSNMKLKTMIANVEKLPFEDNSFDTVICLHTLEHVKRLHQAISELKRVTRKRIVVIVPKQRYFRYTPDYHLNFFGSPEQLKLAMGLAEAECQEIDFCLCYTGSLPS